MIIAIDGPAGSGKSTVAKQVARMLGFQYLDTGAMYRSVAWYALEHQVNPDDVDALARIAQEKSIEFRAAQDDAQPSRVFIDGVDVTGEIRTPRIDKAVTPVSAIPEVRSALVLQQRAIASTHNVVMEGRDIGTVVFPNAEVKVFLTASAEERARRRAAQNRERGFGEVNESAILQDIIRRDEADSTRAASPLKPADDAHMLDTTDLSIDEVCEIIAAFARELL